MERGTAREQEIRKETKQVAIIHVLVNATLFSMRIQSLCECKDLLYCKENKIVNME